MEPPTDRPTLLPSLPQPFTLRAPSLSLVLYARLAFSPRVSRNFDLDEIFSRNCRHVAEQREKRGRSNYKSHRHPKSQGGRGKKAEERIAGWGRITRGESSNHLFQSSRGTRDSIREINDCRIGTILRRAPSGATRRNPVSRPSDSKNEGHGKEIPSRADRKRDWEYR